MRVPCRARARFKRHVGPATPRRLRRLEQRINPHRAGKPIRRSFVRWLGTTPPDFHFGKPTSFLGRANHDSLGEQLVWRCWIRSSKLRNKVRSNRLYVIAISAVAALGGFLFGFDSGVINGTVDALNRAFHTSNLGSGFNVASILLGCALGAFIAGALSDKWGRRAVLIVAAILFVLGSWGTGIAHVSLEFIAYRAIGGAAVAGAAIIRSPSFSEIAPAQIRGRLASLQQLAIVLGLFLAFLSN